MYKYLAKTLTFIPLMPPIGNIPDSEANNLIEYCSWENDLGEQIKIIFPHPIKKTDKTSEKEIYESRFFNYIVEITTEAGKIEDAADRSIFLLEQALDTCSFFAQAGGRILELISIVNLSQIEEIIKNKKGSFEKGSFAFQRVENIKTFPPAGLVFLTEHGIKNIGRNLFWLRRGLSEFNTLNRFVSFFTALKELDYYFKEQHKTNSNFPSSVVDCIENHLKAPAGSFKKWSDIRNSIIHFSGKKEDYRKLNNKTKVNLSEIYKYCYYSIAKFFTDNPPPPIPIVFYDDIYKVVVDATPEIVEQLDYLWKNRNIGLTEYVISV
jgi:hypothetical protein